MASTESKQEQAAATDSRRWVWFSDAVSRSNGVFSVMAAIEVVIAVVVVWAVAYYWSPWVLVSSICLAPALTLAAKRCTGHTLDAFLLARKQFL